MELTQAKKPLIKRFWWIFVVLCIIVISLVFAVIRGYLHENKLEKEKTQYPIYVKNNEFNEQNERQAFGWPNKTTKYITFVPVNLSQLQSISKYRSCAGHDRSGFSFERTLETDRSMKHYLYPTPEFQGTTDKIRFFSPFDGTIDAIQLVDDSDPRITYVVYMKLKEDGTVMVSNFTRTAEKRIKMGNDINIATDLDRKVVFGFRHVQFINNFKPGDIVKAGEFIGYASVAEIGNDFDIDLVSKEYYVSDNGNSIEVLDSMFDHMTDPVLLQFAKYGITPENTKFSKEYRDANPCGYNGEFQSNSPLCRGRENDCWVQLEK